jgi:ABC-2 type transport system permease protein
MSAGSGLAVIRKEFIQISRDRRTLLIALALPAVMLVLFGYAITLDIKDIPFGVLDYDRSNASADFIQRFQHSNYFRFAGYLKSEEAIKAGLDRGRLKVVFIIPVRYEADLKKNRVPALAMLLDGSNANTASVIISYTNGLLAKGLPVAIQPKILYNPTSRSTNFLVPGLLTIIMMALSVLLTALSIVREKELGTLELLRAGPLKPVNFVLGKLLPYALIALADCLLVIIIGRLLFGVPIHGSLLLLVVLTVPFLVACLALGLLFSTLVGSQQVAMYVAFLSSLLPSFLLSGFVFPIASMPKVIQWLTVFVPARYFLVIVRGIFLKGVGLDVLWQPVLTLCGFAAVIITLAIIRLRRML